MGFLLGGVAGLGIGTVGASNFRYPTLYIVGCAVVNAFAVGLLAHFVYRAMQP